MCNEIGVDQRNDKSQQRRHVTCKDQSFYPMRFQEFLRFCRPNMLWQTLRR